MGARRRRPVVSIVRTEKRAGFRKIDSAVRRAVELAGGLEDVVRTGDLVLITPNWITAPSRRLSGAVTRWEVARSVADLVRDLGGRPVIADSASRGFDTERVIAETGYGALREKGYDVRDLKADRKVRIPTPGGLVLKAARSFKLVADADVIISVPVMKTHDQATLTLSLKNLKGLVTDPEKKYLHLAGIFDGTLDVVSALRPAFAVVDGTVAQDGLGPVFGRRVDMNVILAGRDLVAVDAVGGAVMGIELKENFMAKRAAERGLGVADLRRIEVRGEPVERVRRRFRRVMEDPRVNLRGVRWLQAPEMCTGCQTGVFSSIFDMQRAGQTKFLRDITVVSGGDVELPEGTPSERIVSVGSCVPPGKRGSHFVKGCPPNNSDIVKGILSAAGEAGR